MASVHPRTTPHPASRPGPALRPRLPDVPERPDLKTAYVLQVPATGELCLCKDIRPLLRTACRNLADGYNVVLIADEDAWNKGRS